MLTQQIQRLKSQLGYPLFDRGRSGRIDVGLGRDVESFGSEFASLCLDSDAIFALLPTDHRLAGQTILQMASLSEEDFVFFPEARGAAFYRRMLAPCLRAGFRPRVVQETAEWLTLMALVSAGLGVSLIPRRVGAYAPSNTVARPIDDKLAQTAISLWWLDGNQKAAVSHLRAIAADTLP